MRKKLKGWGPFGIFQHPFCRKTSKNAGGPFGENFFSKKSLAVPKKMQGDPLGKFFFEKKSRSAEKMQGGTLWGFFSKSLAVPKKNERGDPLVSPGTVCYAGKQENPFGSVR